MPLAALLPLKNSLSICSPHTIDMHEIEIIYQ